MVDQELKDNKVFSCLDMRDSYHQLEISDDVKDLTTFTTNNGIYRYRRLCMGIAPAPSIFSCVMAHITKNLNGIKIYLDDIFIVAVSGIF